MLSSEEYTHPVKRAINMTAKLQTHVPWDESAIANMSVSSKTFNLASFPDVVYICIFCVM